MGKTYIGIDPGKLGYICVQRHDGTHEFCSVKESSYREIAMFLKDVKTESDGDCVCCMESIHAIYGSSAKGTFSFGETFGVLQGLLIAIGIPYHLVQPRTWQSEMWVANDKVYKTRNITKSLRSKSVDNKPTSINAAMRIFPDVDFRRNEKCKKPDDNKCDAALICEYGRRKNL